MSQTADVFEHAMHPTPPRAPETPPRSPFPPGVYKRPATPPSPSQPIRPQEVPQDKEIVDATPDFTPEQDKVIHDIYARIAQMIPELGRDYEVDISFPNHDNIASVKMKGLTQIGDIWIQEVQKTFNKE